MPWFAACFLEKKIGAGGVVPETNWAYCPQECLDLLHATSEERIGARAGVVPDIKHADDVQSIQVLQGLCRVLRLSQISDEAQPGSQVALQSDTL